MDPVSVLGVAAATIQFVDLTSKLMSRVFKAYRRSSEANQYELRDLELVAIRLNGVCKQIEDGLDSVKGRRPLSYTEGAIAATTIECNQVSIELLDTIRRVAPHHLEQRGEGSLVDMKRDGPFRGLKKGVWERLREAISSIGDHDKVDILRQRLDGLRQQLMVEMLAGMMQYVSRLVYKLVSW